MSMRKFYVSTAAGQVHGRRIAGPGAPVILLHRTPVDSSSFTKVLEFLQGKQEAIALDTPGFGNSFMPDGNPTAEDFGRWVLEAIDNLGIDEFHLAAHHTGTHFATEIECVGSGMSSESTLRHCDMPKPSCSAKISPT